MMCIVKSATQIHVVELRVELVCFGGFSGVTDSASAVLSWKPKFGVKCSCGTAGYRQSICFGVNCSFKTQRCFDRIFRTHAGEINLAGVSEERRLLLTASV